ncbi:MAG: pilus assembly protein TadG-related protein [Actinomycetota bacterium]
MTERGSATTFVVVLMVPMLAMAALALDGGRILAARRQAIDVAQNAALAGAQAADESSVRGGTVAVDERQAIAAAEAYLTAADTDGQVRVVTASGEVRIEVTTTVAVATPWLAMVGITERQVDGAAVGRLTRGVDAADT